MSSLLIDSSMFSEERIVFLLDGNVVAELDNHEARIFRKDGSTKKIDKAQLSKEDPYAFSMPRGS